MAERTGTWDGGYIHEDGRGRSVYVIRQQIAGVRYEVSTRAFTERAALEQWKRFQSNPEGYDPNGGGRPKPIYLDGALSKAYLAYSRDEKRNSKPWRAEQKTLLAWWAKKLHGIDLRGASLRDSILPVLGPKTPSRQHKVTVIKGLYSWLRKVRREIALAEDPTAAGMLVLPPVRKQPRAPKAVTRDEVAKARKHLSPTYRDPLDLQAETGWHVTEVRRFAADGGLEEPTPAQRERGVAGVLVVEHKSGEQHRTEVSAKTLAAAKRLRERKGISIQWYHRAVKAAGKAAGIDPFGPGIMRHSVATWAVNGGTDHKSVSTFLGHKSPRTTQKFYAAFATPWNPMLPPVQKKGGRRRAAARVDQRSVGGAS